MSYYGVFHGDRRESSKLKTALRKRPVCPDGFSFSAAPSYRYMPPCTSTQRSNHAKRDPAPILEPRSLRDLSTGRNVRNFVIHRSYPRAEPLPLPARQLHYVKFDAHDKTHYTPQDKQHDKTHYTPQDKQHDKTHDTESSSHERENQNPDRSPTR